MEEPAPNQLAFLFPAPPSFWRSFTPENLERIAELRAAQESTQSESAPIRLLGLPTELRCLQPPELPAEGTYRCFGDVYNMNDPLPSLEEQNIQQLYSPPGTPTSTRKHTDRALILKRLAKSLLLNFLELVGIMSINPELYHEKVMDLRTLFINFHHLLNEYRPHQARESLILMMQDQLEKTRAETRGIWEMKEKVDGILAGLGNAKLAEDEGKKGQEEVEEGADIWGELEKEFE